MLYDSNEYRCVSDLYDSLLSAFAIDWNAPPCPRFIGLMIALDTTLSDLFPQCSPSDTPGTVLVCGSSSRPNAYFFKKRSTPRLQSSVIRVMAFN